MFAVLTRMRKANADRYGRSLSGPLTSLTAIEKMELYTLGKAPERLEPDAQKILKANVPEIFAESDAYPIYEGRIGASPREMRVVLLDAAQSVLYKCLSPLAVLDEIDQLSERRTEFEWLQQDPVAGGYHDVRQFREMLFGRLLGASEQEFYASSGLIDDTQYADLFERYVQHVSVWTKRERIRNKLTGEYEEPDEKMMREVERLLEVKGDAHEARKQMISAIAAWSIDHPGRRSSPRTSFPSTSSACARRSSPTADPKVAAPGARHRAPGARRGQRSRHEPQEERRGDDQAAGRALRLLRQLRRRRGEHPPPQALPRHLFRS